MIRLAFAGTGYIAQIHAQAAQQIPEVKLAAAINPAPELRQSFMERFHITQGYTSVEEMLAEKSADALVICTPNALHAPQAIAALRAGVHVLVEKPMALNAAQASQMIAASQESGASLMIAHCWRFDEEVQWLRKQVVEGRLGRIVRTKGYGVHVWWGPSGWFSDPELSGGGALVDMGVHALDTARYLLGDPRPVRVYARLGAHYQAAAVDDTGMLLVSWEDGTESYIESGWWQPHSDGPEAATQLYGTAGFGQLFPTFLELPNITEQRVDTIHSGFTHPREPHCLQSMYDTQMAHFIESIRLGQSPRPGGRDGWINQRLLDAAYQSASSGQAVVLSWDM